VAGAPELIASDGFVRLVKELRDSWDVVVIDTPPVLATADAVEIARAVDGLLFVVRANQTDEDKLKKAVERLRRVNAPLVGLVLNGVRKGEGNYEYDAYYYAERSEDSQPPRQLVHGAGEK
jgi:Mrp family chromosome partitioning ATPase